MKKFIYIIFIIIFFISCRKNISTNSKKHYIVFTSSAFTPNNDGLNETWEMKITPVLNDSNGFDFITDSAELKIGFVNYSLKIFSEKNTKIHEINNHNISWDGKVNGKKVPAGLYKYELQFYSSQNDLYHEEGEVSVLY